MLETIGTLVASAITSWAIEKARDLWTKAYKIFINTLGADHPNTKIVSDFLKNINGSE